MGLVCDNPSTAVQGNSTEEQDDLCYATVSFSKNQEDPVYSNIRPAQLNRHENEEEEEKDQDCVEYTVVQHQRASASPEWVHENFHFPHSLKLLLPFIAFASVRGFFSDFLNFYNSLSKFFIHRLKSQDDVEDLSALYSTVTKTPRAWKRLWSVTSQWSSRFPQWQHFSGLTRFIMQHKAPVKSKHINKNLGSQLSTVHQKTLSAEPRWRCPCNWLKICRKYWNFALILTVFITILLKAARTDSIHLLPPVSSLQCELSTKSDGSFTPESVDVSHVSVFVDTPLKCHFGCTAEINNRGQLLSLTDREVR